VSVYVWFRQKDLTTAVHIGYGPRRIVFILAKSAIRCEVHSERLFRWKQLLYGGTPGIERGVPVFLSHSLVPPVDSLLAG
jgi:hypothetical protein